jgi:hypothetical protein
MGWWWLKTRAHTKDVIDEDHGGAFLRQVFVHRPDTAGLWSPSARWSVVWIQVSGLRLERMR